MVCDHLGVGGFSTIRVALTTGLSNGCSVVSRAQAWLLLDLFLALHGREERYLIVACTVITDVPEAVGP
jgi:hypothetical protein